MQWSTMYGNAYPLNTFMYSTLYIKPKREREREINVEYTMQYTMRIVPI